MPMGDATNNPKARLRRELEARRQLIAATDLASASVSACAGLVESELFRGARHVVVYAARSCEVDPRAVEVAAERTGIPTYYPRVETDGLAFRRARFGELVSGRFGLREPLERAQALDPGAPDLIVIVPGVAFDRRGNRLGTGRGYYDRALPTLTGARRVGLTLEALIVDAVPIDPWDVPMDAIATERGFFLADPQVGADPGDHTWT
jgi:5-formyltetrahydrofolate cyclo-ligase